MCMFFASPAFEHALVLVGAGRPFRFTYNGYNKD